METDFIIRRAMRQAKLERKRKEEEALKLNTSSNGPDHFSDKNKFIEEFIGKERSNLLVETVGILTRGFFGGGIAGITIGSIYAFGTSHPSPIGVSVSTAINLGLVSAQYAGFRFILPSGIERGVTSHLMSQEERDLVKYGVSPWEILDIKLPPMFSDLNERDKKVLGSVAAGALSGYINTSLQAYEIRMQHKNAVSPGLKNLLGVRGAVFYGLVFGFGHYFYLRFWDWQTRNTIDEKLRKMYEENPESLKKYSGSIPERQKVVRSSLRQIFENPSLLFTEFGWDIPTWLPLVFSEEDYQYRKNLEEETEKLEAQVNSMNMKIARLRKQISALEK